MSFTDTTGPFLQTKTLPSPAGHCVPPFNMRHGADFTVFRDRTSGREKSRGAVEIGKTVDLFSQIENDPLTQNNRAFMTTRAPILPSRAIKDTAIDLLIIGMHRSGTSALAGCLTRLGYAEPKNPMPANFANPKGYGESNPVRYLNDSLLNAVGLAWSRPALLDKQGMALLSGDNFMERIRETLDTEFPGEAPFVLKDPRISLLFEPWSKAIAQKSDRKPGIVIALRAPNEVVQSLGHRDAMGPSQVLYLWLRYMLEAERHSRKHDRAVVSYDALLEDPVKTLAAVANRIGFSWPRPLDAAVSDLNEFLDEDLRQNRDRPANPSDVAPLDDWAAQVYDLLAGEAATGRPADPKALDQIRRAFDKASKWFVPMLSDLDAAAAETNHLRRQVESFVSEDVSEGKEGVGEDGAYASRARVRAEVSRDLALKELQRTERALQTAETRLFALESSVVYAPPQSGENTSDASLLAAALDKARGALPRGHLGKSFLRDVNPSRYRVLTTAERTRLAAAIDEGFYAEQAAEAGLSVNAPAVLHYLREGARAGLSPHPLFNVQYYRAQCGEAVSSDLPDYADFILAKQGQSVKPHPLFDPEHYLGSNPDVAAAGMVAHVHYAKNGWKEDRSPNAWFYPLWYISQNPDVLKGGNPLMQFASIGEQLGYRPHPSFDPDWYRRTYLDDDPQRSPLIHYLEEGQAAGHLTQEPPVEITSRLQDTRKTLLCVAHSASERLYGSERSFIDVLGSLDRTQYRIVAVLPKPHPAYVEVMSSISDLTLFTRRRWWKDARGVDDAGVREFEDLIGREGADAVYVNTIMLREPLVAAQNKGVPAICHVREAIVYDADLIEEIGLDAPQIIEQVRRGSDYLIANSSIMVDMYGGGDRTHLVYNAVDVEGTLGRARWKGRGPLVAGSLSSNIAKKGIADIVTLAEAAEKENLPIIFKLFGPHTEETRRLEQICKRRRLSNVEFPGYAPDAKQAVNQIDVVLNFSHFAESFGRTIVEAGAASRPAIVYDHGALPEVVEDGVTGVVIPYMEPLAALPVLKRFIETPELYLDMGRAARKRAEDMFSHTVLSTRINTVFDTMLEDSQSRATGGLSTLRSRAGETAPVSVIVPNYNYEDYLPERLRSIIEQSRPPAEIIFLDDASPDDSVAVAKVILEACDIPYTILASDENLGVYKQWLKGLDVATQPWVWIAEADDTAEPDFLEKLLAHADDGVNIVYAQSRKIDGDGLVTHADNRAHTNAVSPTRWSRDYAATGQREVLDALAFRNTIPNASAVLLRKSAIAGLEEKLLEMQYTGDWLLYAHMLRTGGIRFVSEPLNHFRRHGRSVTRTRGKDAGYLAELARIRLYMAEHFPLRLEDFDRMNHFLNIDYKIDGETKNSDARAIAPLQKALRDTLSARHRFGIITTNNGSYNGGSEMLWQETALRLREDGHDVVVLIQKWDPRPELFDVLEAAGITLLFKEEDGFERLRTLRPDLTIVSIGDQDEGLEFYPDLIRAELPYVIVNQLTKEARFWPVRAAKVKPVTQGYIGALQTFFTSHNNHRVMEERLATPLPGAQLHFNPYHIDRSVVPDWPKTDEVNIAIPSKLLFIHKGQDILTEFLGKSEWQSRNLRFNFYGAGPDEENLRAMARKNGIRNFELHGRVDDISEIWRLNQALLMPSRMEGLPIMLVSAMLSARVPILTDIGGHAEVVSDDMSGFIAPDPTADDVEDALSRALARHEDWPEIGRKARAAILDFLPEDPVEDFVGKLIGLLKGAPKD